MEQKSGQFEGRLESFNLFDLTQTLMMGRRNAAVCVVSEGRRGWIHFRDGQIIAGLDHTLVEGEKAVRTIFSWTTGQFQVDFEAKLPRKNVEIPTDSLLLDMARNVDEVRRDKGLPAEGQVEKEKASEVEDEVTNRFEHKLQQDLTGAFRSVADDTENARARYSKTAFDPLLRALLDLEGRVLFLREGRRPRVRMDHGFSNIRDQEVTHDEINGFLRAVLAEGEQETLRNQKEVMTFFQATGIGAFRMTALDAHGTLVLTFSPAAVAVPLLEDFPLPTGAMELLTQTTEGLIVVAGPLGSGKAATVTALIDEHLERRGAFAFEFTNATGYSTETDKGFVIRRALPPSTRALHEAIQGAVWQGPDILAIVGAPEREGIDLGLGAAGPGRLVILSLESHSLPDTLRRLIRFGQGDPQAFLLDALADRLRLVLHLEAGRGALPRAMQMIACDREVSEALRRGDQGAVRAQLTAALASASR